MEENSAYTIQTMQNILAAGLRIKIQVTVYGHFIDVVGEGSTLNEALEEAITGVGAFLSYDLTDTVLLEAHADLLTKQEIPMDNTASPTQRADRIWIVFLCTGAYDEASESMVCAYWNEAEALALKEKLDAAEIEPNKARLYPNFHKVDSVMLITNIVIKTAGPIVIKMPAPEEQPP